jgi:hypothetical protein
MSQGKLRTLINGAASLKKPSEFRKLLKKMTDENKKKSLNGSEKYSSYQRMLLARLKNREGISEKTAEDYFTSLERIVPKESKREGRLE